MNVRYRLLIGVATILLTAAITALFEIVGAPESDEMCIGAEEREEVRALTLLGIDQAYKDQIAHLFQNWVQDPAEQPKRASKGTQQAISAHQRARNNALAWNPPKCQ